MMCEPGSDPQLQAVLERLRTLRALLARLKQTQQEYQQAQHDGEAQHGLRCQELDTQIAELARRRQRIDGRLSSLEQSLQETARVLGSDLLCFGHQLGAIFGFCRDPNELRRDQQRDLAQRQSLDDERRSLRQQQQDLQAELLQLQGPLVSHSAGAEWLTAARQRLQDEAEGLRRAGHQALRMAALAAPLSDGLGARLKRLGHLKALLDLPVAMPVAPSLAVAAERERCPEAVPGVAGIQLQGNGSRHVRSGHGKDRRWRRRDLTFADTIAVEWQLKLTGLRMQELPQALHQSCQNAFASGWQRRAEQWRRQAAALTAEIEAELERQLTVLLA